MATKSFLKNITIKNKRECNNLVKALENAANKHQPKITFSKSYSVATREDVRKMFAKWVEDIKLSGLIS